MEGRAYEPHLREDRLREGPPGERGRAALAAGRPDRGPGGRHQEPGDVRVPRRRGAHRGAPGPGALYDPAPVASGQAVPRAEVRRADLRRVLVLAASPRDRGVRRRAREDHHRRGDAQAPQGVPARRGPNISLWRLQPLAEHLWRAGQVRPQGGRGLHQPARPVLARVQPAAWRGAEVILAKTEAAGERGLLPEVLAFTSSLPLDRQLLREDLAGSLAHLTMLSRCKIVPEKAALAIRGELVKLWDVDPAQLPPEEDVHMAVEARLTAALGETAGMLHTARSRNDQVALDLRLHVREQAARALEEVARLLGALVARAREETGTILPSYTHRQRAQPISLAYLLCGYGAMFARDADALRWVLAATDAMPLGVGAIAGTSLPIDREITRKLLRFEPLTENGLDTVGDRDFALDYAYSATRALLHASRVAT